MQGRSCFNPQQRNIPTMTRNLEPKSAEPHHRTQSNGAFGGTIRQVQGPRVFGIALPSADIYREATDRTAGSVQALTRRSKTRPGKPFDLVDLQLVDKTLGLGFRPLLPPFRELLSEPLFGTSAQFGCS